MTITWKIGFFAVVALAAVVMLGLNGRAEGDALPGDDMETLQYCSVVDPTSACYRGYGLFIWDRH